MKIPQKYKIIGAFLVIMFSFAILIPMTTFSQNTKGPSLWRRLFPPKDLFELVVKETIDVASTGVASIVTFKIKYDGPYVAGILLEQFSRNSILQKSGFKLRIKCDIYANGNLCFSRVTTENYTSFLGLRGNGLWLMEFQVPEEVPLKEQVTCKITIFTADEALQEKYGPIAFYIQKRSDK